MKFYIVDAFTEEIFGGNTAGVVLIDKHNDFPDEDTMIKTAAELRYSETAFAKEIGKNRFHIIYFTPVEEVDLCGHATIGCFGVLLNQGIVAEGDKTSIETKAGNLIVEIIDSHIFMEMGEAKELSEIKDMERLASCLGINIEDIVMIPAIISTGLPDVIVGIKSKEALLEMKPDFELMAKFSKANSVIGIHAFALSKDSSVTAFCRNFAPLYGIDEESATGTANGALTYYLYKRGIIESKGENVFVQGESMGRPSRIISKINTEKGISIVVGGKAFIVAQGEIHI